VKHFYKITHFWIILVIMLCGAIIFYFDRIPWLHTTFTEVPFQFARYSTYRILSIIPVAYTAFIFRWQGGTIAALLIALLLLPRAIFFSSQTSEAITETIAFFFISLLVTWLIHQQQRALDQAEKLKEKLGIDVEVIKENGKRLDALNRISSTVSESLELETILNNAIDNVVDVMHADVAWIFLLDEKSSELSLAVHRGSSEELARGVDRLKVGEGFNGRVAQTGEPLFVENASKDLRLTREVVSKYELQSALIVPISSKKMVNGTLCIAMRRYRQFTPEEVELLTNMGNQIGIAVENAGLYKQQKITTQQLRISEERYRGLFENSSDAIFICSTSARIISINQTCEELTGYTPKELADTVIYELIPLDSRDKIKQLFSEKLGKAPRVGIEEAELLKKNGMKAYVELRVSPILRGKQIIGMQVIAEDVTQEKQLRKNMEYYVKQITRAQEDERLRISRELHDDTAQLLSTLSRDLDSLITRKSTIEQPVKKRLQELHEMSETALKGVRRFSQDLRPSILDDLGLVPALKWLIATIQNDLQVSTNVDLVGDSRRLSPEIELTVFRITQEVISNIRRHSNATGVELTLDYSEDALTLVVSDNGSGFNVPERTSDLALSGKLGIIGMRERARLVGGTLIVQSEKDVGTTVTLRVPYQA
jgi:PAS domain S-box-containing protein